MEYSVCQGDRMQSCKSTILLHNTNPVYINMDAFCFNLHCMLKRGIQFALYFILWCLLILRYSLFWIFWGYTAVTLVAGWLVGWWSVPLISIMWKLVVQTPVTDFEKSFLNYAFALGHFGTTMQKSVKKSWNNNQPCLPYFHAVILTSA